MLLPEAAEPDAPAAPIKSKFGWLAASLAGVLLLAAGFNWVFMREEESVPRVETLPPGASPVPPGNIPGPSDALPLPPPPPPEISEPFSYLFANSVLLWSALAIAAGIVWWLWRRSRLEKRASAEAQVSPTMERPDADAVSAQFQRRLANELETEILRRTALRPDAPI